MAGVLATWFGCGYSPFAPGTAGSLGAIVPAYLLTNYAGWPVWIWPAAAIAITAPAIWAADVTARLAGKKDPGLVVVDEVAGQWLALAPLHNLNWKGALAAFLLFRILDVFKPPPARQFERLPGGTGIVADDLMAGIYAALILWLAVTFFPGSIQ